MPFRPITTKMLHSKKSIDHEEQEKSKIKEDLISLEEERVYREGTVAIRDLIAPSAFKVDSNLSFNFSACSVDAKLAHNG